MTDGTSVTDGTNVRNETDAPATGGVDIIGLGEVVVDWVAQIDHFPAPDEKVDAISQARFPGGVTANYATAVARLGGSVGFVGAIGDDAAGDFLVADFHAEGVDTTGLQRVADLETPVNFIFVVTTTGEKTIIQSPFMQTTKPVAARVPAEYFAGAKVLHTTAIHPAVTRHALALARAHGLQVTLDLEGQIAARGWDALADIVTRVDVLMPNKQGALALADTDDVGAAARFFVQQGVPVVVMTLGAEGCRVVTAEGLDIVVPGFPIQPVDTTGAGDTFTGAFDWAYHLRGAPLEEALRFANAAAALKCLQLGARTGMPTLAAVRRFLADHDADITV